MKILQYILASIIPLAINHGTMISNKVEKQLFQQKVDKLHSNYIELFGNKGSKEGVFYGVELVEGKRPVYFKSKIDSLKFERNEISFQLNKFIYSFTSFYKHEPKTLLSPNDERLQGIIRFQQRFFGTATNDTLNLRRVLPIYDGRSDIMVFIKVASSDDRRH